jgi:hypothetical protein
MHRRTRAIVARSLFDDFVAGVAEVFSKIVVGDRTIRTPTWVR